MSFSRRIKFLGFKIICRSPFKKLFKTIFFTKGFKNVWCTDTRLLVSGYVDFWQNIVEKKKPVKIIKKSPKNLKIKLFLNFYNILSLPNALTKLHAKSLTHKHIAKNATFFQTTESVWFYTFFSPTFSLGLGTRVLSDKIFNTNSWTGNIQCPVLHTKSPHKYFPYLPLIIFFDKIDFFTNQNHHVIILSKEKNPAFHRLLGDFV